MPTTTLTDIVFSYPPAYAAHPAPQPPKDPFQAARRRLRSRGVLATPRHEKTYEALRADLWVRFCYPGILLERIQVLTEFLAVWALHDDAVEGVGVTPGEAARHGDAVMAEGPPSTGADPFERSWWELGRRFAEAGMSGAWRQRVGSLLTTWYHATVVEAALTRKAYPISGAEWIDARKGTTGMALWVTLIEYAYGRELAPETAARPEVAAIHDLADELETYHNDVFGVAKDAREGLPNLVTVTAHENSRSLVQAARAIASEYDAALLRLPGLEASLRAADPDCAWWLQAVRYEFCGVARAHEVVPRYEPVQRLADGTELRVRVDVGAAAQPER
ncbi:terpene synthase family protein [Streptomyces sp. NPDC056632]|uniref:terpene synthase family protein n=1 Tax=Streptomyces sp. NPDC056632 TaxID=3345884 RepID=UPI0036A9D341